MNKEDSWLDDHEGSFEKDLKQGIKALGAKDVSLMVAKGHSDTSKMLDELEKTMTPKEWENFLLKEAAKEIARGW